MSDENPTQTGDLGEQPEPQIEPGEPNPGGADALPEEDDNVPADLGPETNPAVEESPDPLKKVLEEGEDTEDRGHRIRQRQRRGRRAARGLPRLTWVPLHHERSRAGHGHPGLDAWFDRARAGRRRHGRQQRAGRSDRSGPGGDRRSEGHLGRPCRRTTPRRSRRPAPRRCSPRGSRRSRATRAWTRGRRTSPTRTPERSPPSQPRLTRFRDARCASSSTTGG